MIDSVRGDFVMRKDYVEFNEKCKCGFPNFDYQVRRDSGLCRDCEMMLKERVGTYLFNQRFCNRWTKKAQKEKK